MILQIFIFVAGLALLIKGADWLVDGASALAKKYKVSDLAIGLTIVAFGTSAPELVVNSIASFQGHQDIVFGNIIGSNNFNLFMILGIAGLISPLVVQSSTVWKEIPISFVAAFALYILANNFTDPASSVLSRIDGIVLLVLFFLFLYYVYKQLNTEHGAKEKHGKNLSPVKIWAFIIGGLAGLVVGGKLVVSSAIEMAIAWGISEKVIGLTIIAAGTSLPELATSIVATMKKNNDIAVGNVIGSNIFNIFFILAISSLINPVYFDVGFNTDIYLLAAGTFFLFTAMFIGHKRKLQRWQAGILLGVYFIYTIYLIN